MRAELTETFSDEIFSIPAHEYISECRESKLTFKGRAVQKRVYQSLCSYCRKGKSISRGDMSDILRAVEKYREYTNYVKDNSALIERYFGVDITAPDRIRLRFGIILRRSNATVSATVSCSESYCIMRLSIRTI